MEKLGILIYSLLTGLIKKNRTYEEIKLHIESNLHSKYKPNSKTWLIKYSED